MRISLAAKGKIEDLTEPGSSFRISVTGDMFAGNHVDLIPDAERTEFDVMICSEPSIVMDANAYTELANRSLDYDSETDEFIISN